MQRGEAVETDAEAVSQGLRIDFYVRAGVRASGLESGDRLLDGWNFDAVSGKLAIDPREAIAVDVTLRSLRRQGRPFRTLAHGWCRLAHFSFVSEQMQVAVVYAAVNEPLNQPGIAMIGDSGNADLISVCNGSAGFARPTCSIVLTNGTVTARLIARHRDWMPGWSCTDKRICVGDAGSQASTSPPYFQ